MTNNDRTKTGPVTMSNGTLKTYNGHRKFLTRYPPKNCCQVISKATINFEPKEEEHNVHVPLRFVYSFQMWSTFTKNVLQLSRQLH